MIIGVVGLIGSGKGTLADTLVEEYDFIKVAYADALKDATAHIFQWNRALLEGDTEESRLFREKEDSWWTKNLGRSITPRNILQKMGTEAVRDNIHQDIWVYAAQKRIEHLADQGFDDIVIPDVRFPNEIKLIKEQGGIVIRVKRGPEPEWYNLAVTANGPDSITGDDAWDTMITIYEDVHYSEWAWVGSDFDYVIENDSSLIDYKNKIKTIMENLNYA